MIGPEQRLMALGVPGILARELVELFGQGGTGTPLIASNNLSDLTNTILARQNLGLGLFAVQNAVQVQQSATATPAGAGTPESPLSVAVRVSANPDNALVVEDDGLRVPNASSGIPDAPADGATYGRGDNAWKQLASVAISGSYADLSGTPTIPPDPVNADWNATSGLAQILNKPSIPASPGGDFVGTTATQALTNKTLGAGSKESVTSAGTISITDSSAPFQQVTLTGNVTATINLSVGVSRTIWLNPGSFTVTWPAGTWWTGGSAPDIPANKWSEITFNGRPGSTSGAGALVVSEP